MDLSTRPGRREQGQRIQQAVERAGLSIEELAGRIGCSRALIYQYLSGSTLAQPDRLQQIALQCGVSLTFFYTDAPDSELEPPAQPSPTTTAPSTSPTETTADSAANAPLPSAAFAPQEVTARLNDGLRSLQELAGAQESPPDYRAVASTYERILSLSAQLGNRPTQARAQLDLGKALNKIGDYPRAADALNRAVVLAVDTGNGAWERSARQSLGRALTMMGRTDEAREQFQRIVESSDFDAHWRGLLSLGSLDEQQGEYAQAMQRFEEAAILLEEGEINHLAEPQQIAVGLLYVNTNRRNVYLAGGDLAEARRLAEKCLADAEALGNADQNLAARLDLGWCDLYAGRWAQAQTGLAAMLQLARFVGDQRRETMARATLGICQAAAGDFEAALANGKDALALALSHGDRQAELYAHLALTDAYTGTSSRVAEARYHITQALNVTTSTRYARSEIECRLRLARIQALSDEAGGIREAAGRALTLAQNLGARHLESLARAWLAEALCRSIAAHDSAVGENGQESGGATENNADRTQEVTTWREQALREAESALTLADATQFVETRWRAQDTLAGIALLDNDRSQAENHLRAAVTILETLRESLLAAGITDTLLENDDCQNVYARLTRLLLQQGRADDASAFLEQTGWPPLTARFASEIRDAVQS